MGILRCETGLQKGDVRVTRALAFVVGPIALVIAVGAGIAFFVIRSKMAALARPSSAPLAVPLDAAGEPLVPGNTQNI